MLRRHIGKHLRGALEAVNKRPVLSFNSKGLLVSHVAHFAGRTILFSLLPETTHLLFLTVNSQHSLEKVFDG